MQLLRTVKGFRLVGEAAGGKEGVACVLKHRPDLLLLDLNMKEMSGLDVLRLIKQADLDTRVVMITVSDAAEDLVSALRAGADGYLLKDMEPEAMVESLQSAAAGRIVVSDALTHLMADGTAHRCPARERHRRRPHRAGAAHSRAHRERSVEQAHCQGTRYRRGTVKVHVKHVLRKLNLRSRVEAAVWAVEHMRNSR
jgi:two-component system, NarL family, nitrate/nitrite response regulator NarL